MSVLLALRREGKRVRVLVLPLPPKLLVTSKAVEHLRNALSRWRHREFLGRSIHTSAPQGGLCLGV